jgi:phosphatidylglycerol:prolipoprotein diacylglycerol transferase
MLRVPEIQIPLGPLSIPIHFVFETIAYMAGFALYRVMKKRNGDFLDVSVRLSVVVAAIIGAAAGSKVLAWFEDPGAVLHDPLLLLGGKTIVGGLLGGTIAVEYLKSRMRLTARTGDLFVLPLVVGIAIGRLGCFFGGIADRTYGSRADVPWAVDFGDGIPRHPAQLYEILFLIALGFALHALRELPLRQGDLYRIFLFSYLAWRLAVDFLKPEPNWFGLSAIQWACLAGVGWCSRDIARIAAAQRRALLHG